MEQPRSPRPSAADCLSALSAIHHRPRRATSGTRVDLGCAPMDLPAASPQRPRVLELGEVGVAHMRERMGTALGDHYLRNAAAQIPFEEGRSWMWSTLDEPPDLPTLREAGLP